MDIDRAAPAIVELDTVIDAPPARVWALHVDIDGWPTWNPGIVAATLTGPFQPGAVFDWETSGLTISSTVYEVDAERRTVWGGPAQGIDGVHVWTFEQTPDGTRVHTAESWDGDPVRADVPGLTAALRASLVAWLDALKVAAETR